MIGMGMGIDNPVHVSGFRSSATVDANPVNCRSKYGILYIPDKGRSRPTVSGHRRIAVSPPGLPMAGTPGQRRCRVWSSYTLKTRTSLCHSPYGTAGKISEVIFSTSSNENVFNWLRQFLPPHNERLSVRSDDRATGTGAKTENRFPPTGAPSEDRQKFPCIRNFLVKVIIPVAEIYKPD